MDMGYRIYIYIYMNCARGIHPVEQNARSIMMMENQSNPYRILQEPFGYGSRKDLMCKPC